MIRPSSPSNSTQNTSREGSGTILERLRSHGRLPRLRVLQRRGRPVPRTDCLPPHATIGLAIRPRNPGAGEVRIATRGPDHPPRATVHAPDGFTHWAADPAGAAGG